MAVRDDFQSGETLLAQDLNDTFASKLPYSFGTATPSTTDSGFLWYDSNSTPAAPKFWNGSAFEDFPKGLTLITEQDVSAVSSISINNCFTTAYENYVVTWNGNASGPASIRFRMRASAADATGTNYENAFASMGGGGTGAFTGARDAAAADNGYLIGLASTAPGAGSWTFYRPQIAAPTAVVGSGIEANSRVSYRIAFVIHTLSTSYDGVTFYPSGGTFTGTFRVYGMTGV